MENKWTKGPWKFAGKTKIAKLSYAVTMRSWTVYANSEADGHLIAAAPELYEVLEEIANHLYQPNLDLTRCRDLAKSALLKAEGK